jgi:hypothetical protein
MRFRAIDHHAGAFDFEAGARSQAEEKRRHRSPQGLRPEIKLIIEALARDAVAREDRTLPYSLALKADIAS